MKRPEQRGMQQEQSARRDGQSKEKRKRENRQVATSGELFKPLGRPRSSTKYNRPTLQPIEIKSSHSMIHEQPSTAPSNTTGPHSADKSSPEQLLRQYREQPLGTNEQSLSAEPSNTDTSHRSRRHRDGYVPVSSGHVRFDVRGETDRPPPSLLVNSSNWMSASLDRDSSGSIHEVSETTALAPEQRMSSSGHDRTVQGFPDDIFRGGSHDEATTPMARANVHAPSNGIPLLQLDPGQNLSLNDQLTNHVIIFDGGESCHTCQTVASSAGEAASHEVPLCSCNPKPCPRLLFAAIITQAIFNLCRMTRAIGVMTQAACDLLNLVPLSRPPRAKLARCSHPALGGSLIFPKLFIRTRVQFGEVQHERGRMLVVPGNDPIIMFDWTAMQAQTQIALPSRPQATSAFQVQPTWLPVVGEQSITTIDASLIGDVQQPWLGNDSSLLPAKVGLPAPSDEVPNLSYMSTARSDYSIPYTDDVPNCGAVSNTALDCGAGLQMPKMDLAGFLSADDIDPTFALAPTEANDSLSSTVGQPVDPFYTLKMPLDTSTVHLYQVSPYEAFGDEQPHRAFPAAIAHGDGVADERLPADDEADFISVLSPTMRNFHSGYTGNDPTFDISFS